MPAGWRLGEQPDKRFLTSPMRQISTARRYPVMAQVRAPNAPDRSGTEAWRTFQRVRLLRPNMV